jgi:hypothetical protein
MKRNVNGITGYRIVATDGEVGKVEELYLDDQTWVIRYLVVKMEDDVSGVSGVFPLSPMSGRKVLLAPDALIKDHVVQGVFFVNHTKEQIRNSPDIDTDKPVSQQQEIELYGHYAWKGYSESGFYAGGLGSVVDALPEKATRPGADLHLRSTLYITGFHVHATDGEIGCICNFIIDDLSWKVLYVVVDTRHLNGGKKRLVPVKDILQMRWSDSFVYLQKKKASVEKDEVFDEAAFI